MPIRVGESVFKIFLAHGGGSGGTEQAVLNTLKRTRDNVDATCDLYLMDMELFFARRMERSPSI